MAKTIESIEKQIQKLKEGRTALLNQNLESAKKLRARQAYVLGEWLMTTDPHRAKEMMEKLVDPKHRRLFGLGDGLSGASRRYDQTAKGQISSGLDTQTCPIFQDIR